MAQSLSKIIVHIVFSTKDRVPHIFQDIQPELFAYLASISREKGWECYRVGGVADHVHLAVRQPRTGAISDFIGILKKSSTNWLKRKGRQFGTFRRQHGYGAFSVAPSQLIDLIQYINRQAEHHKQVSFQDEYRRILDKYDIEYDERYVWD